MADKTYKIPALPLKYSTDFETREILKLALEANKRLAELKGRARSIPNPAILIESLSLQEALASSEIENIVTTYDQLYQHSVFPDEAGNPHAKEVMRYGQALKLGFENIKSAGNVLTNNNIIEVFQTLKITQERYRSAPGTKLLNDATGEVVYTPPQSLYEIEALMKALEIYINKSELCDLDPLIKMAIIHHQFESIHPFSDGNGRVGRIINILYLVHQKVLDLPILYLSGYITRNKGDYYRLLQAVRDDDEWIAWIKYILTAVAETATLTLTLVDQIAKLMSEYKHDMRRQHPNLYSQDLLNNIFAHPYTRIEYLVRDIGKTRQTVSKYLETLSQSGFLQKYQHGRMNYYVNTRLVELFLNVSNEG